MRRLLLPFVLLTTSLAAAVPAAAEPAPPPCFLTVPAQVVASSQYTAVWPKFTNCAGTTYTWVVRDVTGTVRGFFRVVDGTSQGAWRYPDSSPTGSYTIKPTAASVAATGVQSNSPGLKVKYASKITLKSSRVSDLKVPLAGVVSRYVPSVNEFRRWAHRTVSISYKDCPDCPWKFLALDTTNEYGAFSLGAVSYEARYYRAKVGETETTWGRTSASTYN